MRTGGYKEMSSIFVDSALVISTKYLHIIEYRAVSGVFQTMVPHPPLRTKGGGYTLAGRCGDRGVSILEDAGHCIGLLQYYPSTVIRVQMRGGGWGVAGSHPMSTAVHIT
jgi:hypothetical protein